GNRIEMKQRKSVIRYVVDESSPLSRMLMEVNEDGEAFAWYVYGLGLIGREDADGQYLSYHSDLRGSTTILTNEASQVTDRYTYGLYGELTSHEGSTNQPFRYNGRDGVQTDPNGLYYMRARYYDPKLKRFLNRDVIQGTITDGQTFNRYAYVNGDPVSYIDPLGLSKEFSCGNKQKQLPSDEILSDAVKEWSNMQKKLAPSARKKDRFNTATLAYDLQNDKYYYGMNKGVMLSGDSKSPILYGGNKQSGLLPQESLNRYDIGNCSEVDAVNQALNHGSNVKDLYLYTIETTRKNFGLAKDACANCTITFRGSVADTITGWYKGDGEIEYRFI
ncbi:RHS repeat-associated core domain-containing protein, partial [Paenibacillus kandeliae]|uniref:RHS repeat-associated core domain-containing protein n=1 Tax=Paenibacillus kandeliae TaxID=3231269 RepID=UPI0034588F33